MQIKPITIDKQIAVPFSKSEFLRACLIALLNNKFIIENIPNSEDAAAAINILKEYSNCTFYEKRLLVENIRRNNDFHFHCGESAFLARSLVATSAVMGWDAKITACGSLSYRKLPDIFDFLKRNDIKFEGNSPFLPLTMYKSNIQNPIELDASQSSQLLSGLLIANAFAKEHFVIRCSNYVSKGYVALTLNMLEKVGIIYQYNGNEFYLSNKSNIETNLVTVTGDWSAAAFLMAAGLTSGKVEISNLDPNSFQPDKIFLDFIIEHGLNCSVEKKSKYKVICEKSIIPPFVFDAPDYPDLIPPLVVLAINAEGKSTIKGIHRLLNKESNRASALLEEFAKVGAKIAISDNSFIIEGSQLDGGAASARNDHRIAMSLAVAAINSKSGIVLDNPACVNKSFPDFWEIFK